MFNKALKYLTNKRPDKALPLFKKVLADGGHYKEVYLNLGNCYRLLDRDDEAAACYLKAADKHVPFTNNEFIDVYPLALNNLGLLAGTYEEDETAEAFYLAALEADPLYVDGIWNLANTRLRNLCSRKPVDLAECWKLYEYRFKRTESPVTLKSKKKLLEWHGGYVDHLCILVEQGMGDQLMFGRYIALAESVVGKVTVQCHDRLKSLYKNTCSDPSETDCTHGIPICSLGRIFSDGIPSAEWLGDRLVRKEENGVLDIGITFSGNKDHVNDKHRSCPSRYFKELGTLGTLHALNPNEAGLGWASDCDYSGWDATIRDLGKMHLVITVDTSIAHLCGSLGMPCWVLMPTKGTDWRWGNSAMGYDNIWYKSVRVFRNPGNWDDVFSEVKLELTEMRNRIRANSLLR